MRLHRGDGLDIKKEERKTGREGRGVESREREREEASYFISSLSKKIRNDR